MKYSIFVTVLLKSLFSIWLNLAVEKVQRTATYVFQSELEIFDDRWVLPNCSLICIISATFFLLSVYR